MLNLIIMAFAAASVSFTVTTTGIFFRFREFVSPWHHKIEELIHCPYCMGHYIAAVAMLVYGEYDGVKEFVLEYFAVIGMMAVIHYVLLRAYKPVAKAAAYRAMEKAQNLRDNN